MEARQESVAPALKTFEAMAPVYDDFTSGYDYDGWLTDLLAVLEPHELARGRLLDVACGTGKSFLPMMRWGWRVTGCDISPAMITRARRKAEGDAELMVADMRALPKLGEFDLVWSLDDAVNYLLRVEELEAALHGMRENLAPGGLLLFDVNELTVYRTFYADTTTFKHGGRRFVWRGLGPCESGEDSTFEARLEVEGADPGARCEGSLHRQRHFCETEIRKALRRAGLEFLNVYGHGLDGIPTQPLDPSRHTKAIYIARQA